MIDQIPILNYPKETKDPEWGCFLKEDAKLTALCRKVGIPFNDGFLTTTSGKTGPVNPVKLKQPEWVLPCFTTDPATGMQTVIYRSIMPEGKFLQDVYGPKNQKPSVIHRQKMRRLDQELFGMSEKFWLESRSLVFDDRTTRIIRFHNHYVRQSSLLRHLSLSCKVNKMAQRPPTSRKSWSLPCVSNYRIAVVGDSQVLRLTIPDEDVLCFPFPGADVGDMIHLVSGVKVKNLDDPERHECALKMVGVDQKFVRRETNFWAGRQLVLQVEPNPYRNCQTCRDQCWSKLDRVIYWLGHNNYLKAIPSPRIHPPQLPKTVQLRKYG